MPHGLDEPWYQDLGSANRTPEKPPPSHRGRSAYHRDLTEFFSSLLGLFVATADVGEHLLGCGAKVAQVWNTAVHGNYPHETPPKEAKSALP
jgi:hypothetical protein